MSSFNITCPHNIALFISLFVLFRSKETHLEHPDSKNLSVGYKTQNLGIEIKKHTFLFHVGLPSLCYSYELQQFSSMFTELIVAL